MRTAYVSNQFSTIINKDKNVENPKYAFTTYNSQSIVLFHAVFPPEKIAKAKKYINNLRLLHILKDRDFFHTKSLK